MPPDARPRGLRQRALDIRAEAATSPAARGLLAGTVVAALARRLGTSWRASAGFGLALGTGQRALLAAEHRITREVRNSADAATFAAWLGELVPPLGAWTIEPDFARLVAAELARTPETVVECGSGTTTLLIGRMLRANGRGQLTSLEHDRGFAERTQHLVEREGLQDICRVIWAPLRRQALRGKCVPWYDPDNVADVPRPIDLLVVDGPPAVVPWARWPAVELLADSLRIGATVLLDDGRRRDEQRTAFRWQAKHPELELHWHDTVKGSWRLVKRAAPPPSGPAASAYRRLRRTLNPRPPGFGRWPVQR